MHADIAQLDIEKLIKAKPLGFKATLSKVMWLFVTIGCIALTIGFAKGSAAHTWGAFYVNLLFWMGLACGGVMTGVIFQIVRAKWAAPIRRIGEANVAFLPYAWMLLMATYFGKEVLFPWARGPFPGREWWMQPNFVYFRFAILLAFLFFMMNRFVRMSLRGDIGLVRERNPQDKQWQGYTFQSLVTGWKGSTTEVPALQRRLSWNAPLLMALYAVIYSLFAFEMIMAMDSAWYSNLYGAFNFVGNIYMGFLSTIILVVYLVRRNKEFAGIVSKQQLWDLGKLSFAFCMLWGYMFFSQYLPQWYGNLPEETQWLILRSKEYPWKGISWLTFACAFIVPFILLLSDDIKRSLSTVAKVAAIPLFGVWLEKYVTVMPQLFPHDVPLASCHFGCGFLEIGIFLGFFGAYVLSVTGFLARYPFATVSHPLLAGSNEW